MNLDHPRCRELVRLIAECSDDKNIRKIRKYIQDGHSYAEYVYNLDNTRHLLEELMHTDFALQWQDKPKRNWIVFFVQTTDPEHLEIIVAIFRVLFDTWGFYDHDMYCADGHLVSSFRYTKKRKVVTRYTQWELHLSQLDDFFEIFPDLTIYRTYEWYREAEKQCLVHLVPDLVNLCIEYWKPKGVFGPWPDLHFG